MLQIPSLSLYHPLLMLDYNRWDLSTWQKRKGLAIVTVPTLNRYCVPLVHNLSLIYSYVSIYICAPPIYTYTIINKRYSALNSLK